MSDAPEPLPGPTFRDRLNYLFATHLSPDGDEYSLREVSDGTGGKITIPHLSRMRTGKVALPGAGRLEALAAFFAVPVGFFLTGRGLEPPRPPDLAEDEELREALRNPVVREIAMRAREFDVEEWHTLLEIMKLVTRTRTTGQQREVEEAGRPAATTDERA